MDKKEMSLETLGHHIDNFIHDSALSLTVSKEAGTDDWSFGGVGLSPVLDLFVYLNALRPLFLKLVEMYPQLDYKNFVDDVLDLIRDDIVDTLDKVQGGGK